MSLYVTLVCVYVLVAMAVAFGLGRVHADEEDVATMAILVSVMWPLFAIGLITGIVLGIPLL